MGLIKRFVFCFAALISGTCMIVAPLNAAERLTFTYGPFSRSLQLKSLQTFAETGEVSQDLAPYLKHASAEKKQKLRGILTKKLDISPLMISRFLYTQIGEDVISLLGQSIQLPSGANGRLAIRSAMVEAALAGGGLSLLNVMESLPTNVQFDGNNILAVKQEVDTLLIATKTVVEVLRELSAEEAKAGPAVDFSEQEDISRAGSYEVMEETWNLSDQGRDRTFYVKIYRPNPSPVGKISVVVFSHGLMSSPEAYQDGLKNLASRGYLVAAPQHPGSDAIWFKGFANGLHSQVADVNELINRPKDISYVIDELERRNQESFDGNLNLETIGMAGHSYGGYTSLAVAGATIDFIYLEQRCNRPSAQVDISQLLECQALRLPRDSYDFRDERVKAVYAYNPVNRAIFGPRGLSTVTIPVLLASGSYDFAAPPALEQTTSFTWLPTPDKYWMLLEGQAHVNFDEIDPGIKKSLESISKLSFPSEGLIKDYVKSTSVAFFKVHIDNEQDFRKYLSASYANYLSRDEEFDLFLITEKSDAAVVEAIKTFRAKYQQAEYGKKPTANE